VIKQMNNLMLMVLSLSLAGSIIIAFLFLCKPLYKTQLSKKWQYYIWLIVIVRLLVPVSFEVNLVGSLFNEIRQENAVSFLVNEQSNVVIGGNEVHITTSDLQTLLPTMPETQMPVPYSQSNILSIFISYIWLLWIVIAVILFIRKITIYQSFVSYIKAGRVPLENMADLEQFGKLVEQSNIKRMVGIYTNSLVSSPLLIGFFKPYIVLPTTNISESDFRHTIMHELTHYKRGDIFYKWLVQLTICLHWFNPLVYLMGREINNACEFSCDEAVIKNLDKNGVIAYGNTLLNALGFGGEYKNSLSSVTLSENKKILEERLNMIKNYKKKSLFATICAVLLSALLSIGAGVVGAYAMTSLSSESTRVFDIEAFEQRASAGPAWINRIDYLEIDVEGIDLLILPRHDDANRVSISSRSSNRRVGFGMNPNVHWTNTYNSLSFTGGIIGGMGTGYADGDFMILYVPRYAERIFQYVSIRVRNGNVIIDGGMNLTENISVEVINGDVYIGDNILVSGDTSVVIDGIHSENIAVIEDYFSFRISHIIESGEATLIGSMEIEQGVVYYFDIRFGINIGGVYIGLKAYEGDWLYLVRNGDDGRFVSDVSRQVYVYILVPENSWVMGVWGRIYAISTYTTAQPNELRQVIEIDIPYMYTTSQFVPFSPLFIDSIVVMPGDVVTFDLSADIGTPFVGLSAEKFDNPAGFSINVGNTGIVEAEGTEPQYIFIFVLNTEPVATSLTGIIIVERNSASR